MDMDPHTAALAYTRSVGDQLAMACRDGDRQATEDILDRVAAADPRVAEVFEAALDETSLAGGGVI